MKKGTEKNADKLKYNRQIRNPTASFVAELISTTASTILALFGLQTNGFKEIPIVAWLAIGALAITIYIKVKTFCSERTTRKQLKRIQTLEGLSAETLLAQQRANEAKTRSILQMTYGSVPYWHPFNYRENVLDYDVHEQLRTILIELRNAILDYSGQTDADMVTVDLVYCYPDKKYDGKLPVSSDQAESWRIITSGEGSCLNYKLHDFLSSSESFFFHLDQNNYVFFNDKQKAERYYIPSGKDYEYGKVGSITGMTINIKNDAPEKVLVKAMLTITTYGWKLCEEKSELSKDDFAAIFKQTVLNGYKSMLKSELMQMYIRHMIRDKKMCPHTGIMLNDTDIGDAKVIAQISPHVCPLRVQAKDEKCPVFENRACKCLEHSDKRTDGISGQEPNPTKVE